MDKLFAGLQPITIDEMIGEWRIGYLLAEGTGSQLETFLRYFPIFNLYGKRFLSKNNVKAWVYSFFGIEFSVPDASAIVETVEYRKKFSAAMIYNHLLMIDYFRKVDDYIVMGIMEMKGKVSVYFYLKRN